MRTWGEDMGARFDCFGELRGSVGGLVGLIPMGLGGGHVGCCDMFLVLVWV